MISIIIVNYNSGNALQKCLHNVLKHTQSAYQLYLIDNASMDGSRDFLKQLDLPHTHITFHEQNLGFPKAFNDAVAQTDTDIVIGLDDDAYVPPGWDQQLLPFLAQRTALVGAKIVYPNGRIFSAEYSIAPLGLVGYNERDLGQRDYQRHADAVANTVLAINKHAFLEIGGYDDAFFPCQYEDADLCYRIRQRGYQIVYNGQLTLIHDNLFRSLNRENINQTLMAEKHYAFKHYPLQDSHKDDRIKGLAYRAYENKNYQEAYTLYTELYQNAPFPGDIFYFRTLTLLGKHDQLKAAYHKRKPFFPPKEKL